MSRDSELLVECRRCRGTGWIPRDDRGNGGEPCVRRTARVVPTGWTAGLVADWKAVAEIAGEAAARAGLSERGRG